MFSLFRSSIFVFKRFNQISKYFEVTFQSGLLREVNKSNFSLVGEVNKFYCTAQSIKADKAQVLQDVMTGLLTDGAENNWQHIRNCLLEKESLRIKEVFVNHIIFDYLSRTENVNLALSFCKYVIDNSGSKLNLADVSNIFIVYEKVGKKEGQLSIDQRNFVKDLYKKLRTNYPVLDPRTNSSVAVTLASLNDWKECINIINEIKLAETPTRFVYSSTVDALFRCGEYERGWELLHEMLHNHRQPTSDNYISWLEFCSGNTFSLNLKRLNKIERLFYFIAQNELKLDNKTADKITEVFVNVLHWKAENAKIDFKGTCSVCGYSLRNDPLTLEEYEILRKDFAEHVLIGTNVFTKSTPREVENFIKFLENAPRYDMVVDALNVVAPQPSPHQRGMTMLYLLDKLRTELRNVFILGRKHLLRLEQFSEWKRKSAATYMIQDLSEDDIFFLYATIMGGPKTDFLSRDMMRSHSYQLRNRDSQLLFLRWQRHHQHSLVHAGPDVVIIKRPMRFAPIPQKATGWHIPFEMKVPVEQEHSVLGIPEHWLCLKPPIKAKRR